MGADRARSEKRLYGSLGKRKPDASAKKGRDAGERTQQLTCSEEEVWAALRANGMTNCNEANWVILETNGDMTVIPRSEHNFGKQRQWRT